MTIDERLAKRTARREVLTGDVEILTADLSQLASEVKVLASSQNEHASRLKELASAVSKQRSTMDDLMTGFATLAELAKSHETRIGRLEGR